MHTFYYASIWNKDNGTALGSTQTLVKSAPGKGIKLGHVLNDLASLYSWRVSNIFYVHPETWGRFSPYYSGWFRVENPMYKRMIWGYLKIFANTYLGKIFTHFDGCIFFNWVGEPTATNKRGGPSSKTLHGIHCS